MKFNPGLAIPSKLIKYYHQTRCAVEIDARDQVHCIPKGRKFTSVFLV
jgi:hypothetical protein